MFEAVKRTLESRLRAVAWVDETSRVAMLNKLTHLHGQFLSSPHFRNASYISSLIENVRVDPEDFFGNVIRRYATINLHFSRAIFQIIFQICGIVFDSNRAPGSKARVHLEPVFVRSQCLLRAFNQHDE